MSKLNGSQVADVLLSQTEIWSLNADNVFTITLAKPFLSGFYEYPELFLVDPEFCM